MKALSVTVFSLLFSLVACSDKTNFNLKAPIIQPTTLKYNFTYLALGDSYTIGESVTTYGAFPYQLAAALKSDSVNVQDPKIVAKTGWTTDELINAIKAETLQPKYDVVTLLIGVNNQYREYDIEQYKTEFKQLLQTAIQYAGGKPSHVFVLSIPDWGVTPFAKNDSRSPATIAKEIDAYNVINKQQTIAAEANYLDITPISREAISDPSLIASDGLHPSAQMYARWIAQLAPMVKAKLF